MGISLKHTHKSYESLFLPSSEVALARSLYDLYVQTLFNYGMHLCENGEAVKEVLLLLFGQINPKHDLKGSDDSVRFNLFKNFRLRLVSTQDGYSGNNFSISYEKEAEFLKFYCGFSYEEVAGIMNLEVECVHRFISNEVESLAKLRVK
jgi:hypothetical protein